MDGANAQPALVADATGAASVSAHSGDGQAYRFTPGPWRLADEDSLFNCAFVPVEADHEEGGECIVCEVRGDSLDAGVVTERDRANARLIAAAPELLEALALWRGLVIEGGVPRYTVLPGAALNRLVGMTDAAILKATNKDA